VGRRVGFVPRKNNESKRMPFCGGKGKRHEYLIKKSRNKEEQIPSDLGLAGRGKWVSR